MNEIKKGNYIGKKINNYIIIDKKKVNNRMKYKVKCEVCETEKWTFNPKNCFHGSYCEGKNRKTGSKVIGKTYGDYIVIKKNIRKNRSSYIIKCKICNSIKEVWNLREETHNEHCNNFCNYILGDIKGDFIIKKAYKLDRTYVDLECLVCGCIRERVAYKDFKLTFKNKHDKNCTILNTNKFSNKKLVRKLIRTHANILSRLKNEPAYQDVKILFKDTIDFVTYVYDMFEDRHIKESIPLNELSIDRINPYGNYEKENVRCLTILEQQRNKRIHWDKSVETIENSGCAE